MIIKVPIYCEFETIQTEKVVEIVQALNSKFTKIIRENDLKNIIYKIKRDPSHTHSVPEFSIITYDKALESLRTKK